MNRRAFARLSAVALGLPALAAAERLPLIRPPKQDAAPAADGGGEALLTPEEMAHYEKSLPEAQRSAARMKAVKIDYSVEPDFIFRAAIPKLATRRGRGRRP